MNRNRSQANPVRLMVTVGLAGVLALGRGDGQPAGSGFTVTTFPMEGTAWFLGVGAGSVWAPNPYSLAGTVSRIDPATNRVTDTVADAGTRPAYLTFHDGAMWFANLEGRTMRRLDPDTKRITHVIKGGGGEFAFDDAGGLWAVSANAKTMDGDPEPPLLYRFDARTGEPVARLRIGKAGGAPDRAAPLAGVGFADGSVWVGSTIDGALYRIDPAG